MKVVFATKVTECVLPLEVVVVVSSSILGTFEVVELNRVVNHVDVAVDRVG